MNQMAPCNCYCTDDTD